ncbi:hypothetical protein Hdeb2414_s0017g00507381 [Helianthus debilis subsp. tardiflorus]
MPINKEPVTPPMIGKIDPYTMFVTPSATPKPTFESSPAPVKLAPPVVPPPVQYEKSASGYGSKFDFFWDVVAKVQNAHSSLDDHVARWFGLNQSKYQWALDDDYQNKGVDQLEAKVKDVSTKTKCVKAFLCS